MDGEQGRLIIRGHLMEDIAEKQSFESVVACLWNGFISGSADEESIRNDSGQAREFACQRMLPLLKFIGNLQPVAALRFMLSALSDSDNVPAHVLVTAAMPVFVGGISRCQGGLLPLPPNRLHDR